MAKIGKHYTKVKNQDLYLEVHYSQKRGFYYKGLPQEVYELTKLGNKVYPSEDELKRGLYYALEEYHEKIKTQRKIIIYSLYGSTNLIMNEIEMSNGTGWAGLQDGVSDKFSSSMGGDVKHYFGFTYHVLVETVSKDREYNFIDKDGKTTGRYRRDMSDRSINIIDWTPEREKFFCDLKDQLSKLIVGVSTFFDNPEYLKLMDTLGFKTLTE